MYMYGLLTMAKLAELFMGVEDSGKVQNWEVAKLQIGLTLLLNLFAKICVPP